MKTLIHQLRHDEEGSLAPLIPVCALALIIIIGLVTDGAGKIQTHENARQVAAAAARAATNALANNTVDSGHLALNPQEAISLADDYIQAAGMTGQAYVTDDTITVTTHETYQTKFVNLIGITSLDVTAQAAAKTITEE